MTGSIAAHDDDDIYADRRATPRVDVALPAFLHAAGTRNSVQILDLSAGGAKLDCGAVLPTGTTVMLDCGSLRCAGVVRWQGGRLLGLSFDAELEAREVEALRARSTALAALLRSRG